MRRLSDLTILFLQLLFVGAATGDDLYNGFVNPPESARPQAWWHWMNGNVSNKEALNDLQWMYEVGIGGVQVFEAGMGQRLPDGQRLVYGKPAWKKVLAESASKASELGLDFSITTSPGWSATGGPWVKPEDAMKKLVWSKTSIKGGGQVQKQLPAPPAVAGPYQDIPADTHGAAASEHELDFYRDIAVLAVPFEGKDIESLAISASAEIDHVAELTDGQFWPAQQLPVDKQGSAWLDLKTATVADVQGITLGLPDPRGFGTPAPPLVEFQYSLDGKRFETVAILQATASPVRSASFAPVRAKYFRVAFSRDPRPGFMDTLQYAPGANLLPFPARHSSYAISEITLHTAPHVNAAEEKAGFAAADNYYALANPASLQASARLSEVVDVTRYVGSDGLLSWDAPEGEWRIIRLGYSLTGHKNGPAPEEATGLEVDKLAADKVHAYLETYLQNYSSSKDTLMPGITGLLSDSIESGPQNWTDNMLREFKTIHGYDALLWLPALTGEVIESPDATDRFLWDFRTVISRLISQNHYAVIADFAHTRGLQYYAEALEDHRPQLGNDLDMRAAADIPMSAFWHYSAGSSPKPTYLMDVKGAASVANVYGKPLVAVEAMTTFGHPWAVGPRELKAVADRAFVQGGNRLMLHSSVHQAQGKDFSPGLPMMPLLGHYFNRNVTWSAMAKSWIEYLSRTQYLLQQGFASADFAFFIGEEAPVTGLYGDHLPEGIPAGFNYDFVSASGLQQLQVVDGNLRNRSGNSYKFLYLGGSSKRLTLDTLRRVGEFARSGVKIVGPIPIDSPSLGDDKQEWQRIVDDIWKRSNVMDSNSITEVVEHYGLPPDWQFIPTDAPAESLLVQKRQLPDRVIYYLVNAQDEPLEGQFSLSGSPMPGEPYFWLATTGERHSASIGNRGEKGVSIELQLAPQESRFLVFEHVSESPVSQPVGLQCQNSTVSPAGFTRPWTVEFDQRYGGAPDLELERLLPLNQHADDRVRYYSGVITYRNTFELDDTSLQQSRSVCFSLAGVGDMAEVYVNGQSAGSVWTPPYALDLKPFLGTGENTVEVRVANLWANRLIGMERKGETRDNFPAHVYKPAAPLRPAGLIGPAVLSY
ncbi:glycosyl hydrolase [Parahaliea maris]|nr:glycosyl hydrolase [Parahaliea maris]